VLDRLAVIFAGGCLGGYTRYAVTEWWSTPRNAFPWSTFVVNIAGAFILGVVVVLATDPRRPRYLRPLVGTGFCGALTTFSSVVVAVDQLVAHHHAATAATYLGVTSITALAVAAVGMTAGRAIGARW
jgi:fluoride exporter